ncbi:MAG: hypothetical protein IBX55_13100 [Methyloprofundus sp.]|nr:hypothetical protein [Methyloprofundus sp.]
MTGVIVHMSFQKAYLFKGWLFEYDRNKPFGPWPLKKDFEPRKRAGRSFFKCFAEFQSLPVERQEEFRVC